MVKGLDGKGSQGSLNLGGPGFIVANVSAVFEVIEIEIHQRVSHTGLDAVDFDIRVGGVGRLG